MTIFFMFSPHLSNCKEAWEKNVTKWCDCSVDKKAKLRYLVNIISVQTRLPCHCCFSRTFVDCRAFNRNIALKEDNGEAVCGVEVLPFSQGTIDLALRKRLFFFFAEKRRFSFYICFRKNEITSQTISSVNGKIVFGFLFFCFLFLHSILLGRESYPLMLRIESVSNNSPPKTGKTFCVFVLFCFFLR